MDTLVPATQTRRRRRPCAPVKAIVPVPAQHTDTVTDCAAPPCIGAPHRKRKHVAVVVAQATSKGIGSQETETATAATSTAPETARRGRNCQQDLDFNVYRPAKEHYEFVRRALCPTKEHVQQIDIGTQVVYCTKCNASLNKYICGVCSRPFEDHDPEHDGHVPVSILHFDTIARSNVCWKHGRSAGLMKRLKQAVEVFYRNIIPACVEELNLEDVVEFDEDGTFTCNDDSLSADSLQFLSTVPGFCLSEHLAQLRQTEQTGPLRSGCMDHVKTVFRELAAMYNNRYIRYWADRAAEETGGQKKKAKKAATRVVAKYAPSPACPSIYEALEQVLMEFSLEVQYGTSVQRLLKSRYKELVAKFPYFVHEERDPDMQRVLQDDDAFVELISAKPSAVATKKLLATTKKDVGYIAWAFRHFMAHQYGAMSSVENTTKKWHRAHVHFHGDRKVSEEEEEEEEEEGGSDEDNGDSDEDEEKVEAEKAEEPEKTVAEEEETRAAGVQEDPQAIAGRRVIASLMSKIYVKTLTSIASCQLSNDEPPKLYWPDSFDTTSAPPVPKTALTGGILLAPVYSKQTGLLAGVACNTDVGTLDARIRPLKFQKKLQQVCDGLNSNIRRMNIYSNILSSLQRDRRAERQQRYMDDETCEQELDRKCGFAQQKQLGDAS